MPASRCRRTRLVGRDLPPGAMTDVTIASLYHFSVTRGAQLPERFEFENVSSSLARPTAPHETYENGTECPQKWTGMHAGLPGWIAL